MLGWSKGWVSVTTIVIALTVWWMLHHPEHLPVLAASSWIGVALLALVRQYLLRHMRH